MKTFELLDVCYPDYFTGYHKPVLAIPVYNNMTFAELANDLESELNYGFDLGFTKTEFLICENYINRLRTEPQFKDNLFIGDELEQIEGDDCIVAYFSLCRLNTVNIFGHSVTFADH